MAEIVIIGAGLTGLSTAYHLEKQNFFDFKIFEKETTYGGLAQSVSHDGFTFDFTGHLLHCNDPYFHSLLDTLLPEDERNTIARKAFVYSHNKIVPYPFQMNLAGLPAETITQCLVGFAKRKHNIVSPQNFHEWVLKYFGTGIGKHFFFPYNKKLTAYNLKKITPCWTGQFVPKTSINNIIEGLTTANNKKEVGYNHHFYYPKQNGIQHFTNALRKKITSPIHHSYEVDSVDLKHKNITFTNGHQESFSTLISTMPLNLLLKKLKEPSSNNLRQTHTKLLCNSVININLGFAPVTALNKHWIYIPEKKYSFYRLGFWHNFSKNLVPKGCGSLYGELAHLPHTLSKEEEKKRIKSSIEQMLTIVGIKKNNIVTQKILHLPHAYVIYNQWRKDNLAKLHSALNEQEIYSIGRYGEWKYSSMQDAILDGKQMANKFLITTTCLHSSSQISRDSSA